MHSKFRNTYFTTLAIDRFINLFKDFPETNFIILDSFNNLVKRDIVNIYAFVIMRNHLHLVWNVNGENEIQKVITSFKKFTGYQISNYLRKIDYEYHSLFGSNRKDRNYKIWKLTKGNIRIHGLDMLNIKVRYVHNNPTRGEFKSVDNCADFYFSSANAYARQSSNFNFLTVVEEITPWS